MPATEKTWRDQNLLHVTFAASTLFLLIATLWMIADDHSREWKDHQNTFNAVERTTAIWRQQATDSEENRRERQQLQRQLAEVRSQPPAKQHVDAFKAEVVAVSPNASFAKIDRLYERLKTQGKAAADVLAEYTQAQNKLSTDRAAWQEALESLRTAKPEEKKAVQARVDDAEQGFDETTKAVDQQRLAYEKRAATAGTTRDRLMRQFNGFVQVARQDDINLLGKAKFRRADLGEAKATFDLAVRDGKEDQFQRLQARIDAFREDLTQLTKQQNLAQDHREKLERILKQMTGPEDERVEKLEKNQAEFNQLAIAIDERNSTYFVSQFPFLGKKWLEIPVGDAFNSPHKIDNLWTKGLTQENGSFGQIRRFDRCTTCHKGIDKTAAGSAVEPAYPHEHEVVFYLTVPDAPPVSGNGDSASSDSGSDQSRPSLVDMYGIVLADTGLVDRDDVTVKYVRPQSTAATALPVAATVAERGLIVGDVLLYVNDDQVDSPQQARKLLIDDVQSGETVRVVVRRGLPNPYSSHPRLDLFVGSLSPHKLAVFGCSVCHEGQGSGTEFKWASHTPDSNEQADDWRRQHGWFNNHHWIYPMYPARFAESSCLKCHHDVTELDPSDRFPEAPAPKLMAGYRLVSRYGCFGCHEMSGYKTADERIGPDLRLEPNYFAAAAQVAADPAYENLTDVQKGWVQQLIKHPELNDPRRNLWALLDQDIAAEEPVFNARSHEMIEVLADVEIPGSMRKAGPSLRYVKSKLGLKFLADWVWEPKNFRPNTRMPRFFGHWDHLEDDERAVSEELEPIELAGIVTYLLERSQEFELDPLDEDIAETTPDQQVARGKLLFETRGCLGCHQHQSFPYAKATKGPELSNIGDKFSVGGTPNAKDWLRNWLRSPNNYHARTTMPDTKLDPIVGPDGKKTDPADDIAAYLLTSSTGWKPDEQVVGWATQVDVSTLRKLTREYLGKAFFTQQADEWVETGIPESRAPSLKGAEIELVGGASQKQKLMYIGRKSIAKYGCFGCHDIPGFENAKTIGTSLADWGRKDPSKLAFEHILEYLHGHGHGSHGGNDHAVESQNDEHQAGDGQDRGAGDAEIDESFYLKKIEEHERVGFIWQKLKEPRSYDFKKARNKDFNERLRMPLFPFNDEEREAVITFVLGLVADPPAHQFVFPADPRQQALIAGRKVIDKYNCGGCHILQLPQWDLAFSAGQLRGPASAATYPFMQTTFPTDELQASATVDPRLGVFHSTIHGLPAISNDDGRQIILDDEGDPIEEGEQYDPSTLLYPFQLWKPTLIEGEVVEAGPTPMEIPASTIRRQFDALGGDLTFWLLPRAVELEKAANPNAKGAEAWGWLPPPLIGQGNKVQPSWLHDFLLDPYPIRPAVLMRMPKFNMSSEEASALVNYFAARDGAEYPYEFNDRSMLPRLARLEESYLQSLAEAAEKPPGETRLEHAMNIVTSSDYCVQCHLVADFEPAGDNRAKAPNLAYIGHRLRPEYLRRWLAKPNQILPYTPMPINIEYAKGISQKLYHGTSTEQLDAIVDLLMNYNVYSGQRAKIAPLVKPATAGGQTTQAGAN